MLETYWRVFWHELYTWFIFWTKWYDKHQQTIPKQLECFCRLSGKLRFSSLCSAVLDHFHCKLLFQFWVAFCKFRWLLPYPKFLAFLTEVLLNYCKLWAGFHQFLENFSGSNWANVDNFLILHLNQNCWSFWGFHFSLCLSIPHHTNSFQ